MRGRVRRGERDADQHEVAADALEAAKDARQNEEPLVVPPFPRLWLLSEDIRVSVLTRPQCSL